MNSVSIWLSARPPTLPYSIVPSHEIAGIIDAIGPDVPVWQTGQRVGGGGHCGPCEPCRRGDFINCQYLQTPGITYDDGYAE